MAEIAGRIIGVIEKNSDRFPGVTVTESENNLQIGRFRTCVKLEADKHSSTYIYVLDFSHIYGLEVQISQNTNEFIGKYERSNDPKLLDDIQTAFFESGTFRWKSKEISANAPDCDPLWHTLNRLASVVEQLAHKKRSLRY